MNAHNKTDLIGKLPQIITSHSSSRRTDPAADAAAASVPPLPAADWAEARPCLPIL